MKALLRVLALVAGIWAASDVAHAGSVTISGSLDTQGSGNGCVYSSLAEDAQGNWLVTCGDSGTRTISFNPAVLGTSCKSYSSLSEDSGGNWTVAGCVSAIVAAAVYYVHTDNLGTPREITDSTNAIRWQWDGTDPFGNNLPNENPAGMGSFSYNLRFPGQYFDAETAKNYNYYRDYDPSIGRYVESDPIGLWGGANTYAYVKDSPLSREDPLGLLIRGRSEHVQCPLVGEATFALVWDGPIFGIPPSRWVHCLYKCPLGHPNSCALSDPPEYVSVFKRFVQVMPGSGPFCDPAIDVEF